MTTEQNNQPPRRDNQFRVTEPGRRYRPARIRPRMGADIRRGTPAPTPAVVPAKQSPMPSNSLFDTAIANSPRMNDVARNRPTRKVATVKPAQPRQHKSLVLKRAIATKAKKYQKETRNARKQQFKAFLLGGTVAVLITTIGAVAIFQNQHTADTPFDRSPTPQALGASTSQQSAPDETAVSMSAVTEHVVEADKPRVLRIQRIGINSRITAVMPNLKSEPAATANIHDIGWLSNSAKPGTEGIMVLNGYVTGTTLPGAFAGLPTLLAGDVIQVERGDGKQFNYSVVKVQAFPADNVDMKAVLTSPTTGKPGLSLVSNTGRFNVRTNKFEDRTVVWAVQN